MEADAAQHFEHYRDEAWVEDGLGKLDMAKVARRLLLPRAVGCALEPTVHRAQPQVAEAHRLGPAALINFADLYFGHGITSLRVEGLFRAKLICKAENTIVHLPGIPGPVAQTGYRWPLPAAPLNTQSGPWQHRLLATEFYKHQPISSCTPVPEANPMSPLSPTCSVDGAVCAACESDAF